MNRRDALEALFRDISSGHCPKTEALARLQEFIRTATNSHQEYRLRTAHDWVKKGKIDFCLSDLHKAILAEPFTSPSSLTE